MVMHIGQSPDDVNLIWLCDDAPTFRHRYNGRLFVPAQEETEPKQPNEQQRLMNEMLAQKLNEVKAKQMREQQR